MQAPQTKKVADAPLAEVHFLLLLLQKKSSILLLLGFLVGFGWLLLFWPDRRHGYVQRMGWMLLAWKRQAGLAKWDRWSGVLLQILPPKPRGLSKPTLTSQRPPPVPRVAEYRCCRECLCCRCCRALHSDEDLHSRGCHYCTTTNTTTIATTTTTTVTIITSEL